MEEEKKLYPFRFAELEDRYDWGEETFKLVDLGYRDSLLSGGWLSGNTISEVMDIYCDRVVGDPVFSFYGRQFPIQVKYLHVSGRMPLRVHPDDETAMDRYDFLGKEKVWYIVSADRKAKLFLGFKEDTDATAVYEGCLNNTIESLLNVVTPKAGETYRIKPGTVHAAEGEVVIAEVSQASPMDFCLCGWGKEVSREEFDDTLSIADALDIIEYRKHVPDSSISVPQFTVKRMALTNPLHIFADEMPSFSAYVCISGAASIQLKDEEQTYGFNAGQTLLVPSECNDYILVPTEPGTLVLEVMVENCAQPDPYINPDAEPNLPDQTDPTGSPKSFSLS